jgi:uncharacterized protein YndB with AHSA1/START domain
MGCDIVLALEIEADPKVVYDAIATQEGEASFWTSKNDARPEAGAVAEFRFPEVPVGARMRIDELSEGRRVAWTCLGDFPNWGGTRVIWELEGADGKTHLGFRHEGWPDDHPEHERGSVTWVWAMVTARLKGYAETGTPQPFFG